MYRRRKWRHRGKEKRLARKVYSTLGLGDARDKADAARKRLQAGDDPGQAKKAHMAWRAHEAQRIHLQWGMAAHGFRSLLATVTHEHERTLGEVVERARGAM